MDSSRVRAGPCKAEGEVHMGNGCISGLIMAPQNQSEKHGSALGHHHSVGYLNSLTHQMSLDDHCWIVFRMSFQGQELL